MKKTTNNANKKGPESETSYWTIAISPTNYVIPGPPHRLCDIQQPTAKDLMLFLQDKGWKTSNFTRTANKFCLVEHRSGGFTVTYFPSYAAAVAHDEAACLPA
jgi:hypothetical protein